jgi:transposase, IS5 family
MRITRNAQASIFENYSEHPFGLRLKALSDILDKHPEILSLVEADLINKSASAVGRIGLSVENVFRCLLLKQQLQVDYETLAFHLSDSVTYRTFARLSHTLFPSRSALQATIRKITPETLAKIHDFLTSTWLNSGIVSMEKVRIDSTVIESNIADPSDSRLLNDGIRVLSRLLLESKTITGVKLRFTDQRKQGKSLSFQIFNAKNTEKEALYPHLLQCCRVVLAQVERGLQSVRLGMENPEAAERWIKEVEHYRDLTLQVVDQTTRRVIQQESVPACEKIVSLFEPHTDIIVKGRRDTQYGHKVNLSSDASGFITYFSIEDGNPSDKELFIPVLNYHQSTLGKLPKSTVADGGYASQNNVVDGRQRGIRRVVFHKRVGISLQEMGVKTKTFKKLRDFRAGVEGNISELKRAFGAGKARWKKFDGFCAFAWSAVLSYNLVRLARLNTT